MSPPRTGSSQGSVSSWTNIVLSQVKDLTVKVIWKIVLMLMLIRGVFRIIPNIYNFCENSWLPKVFTTLQYKRNNSPLVSLGIYFDNGTPCLHISLFWHINERTKRYLLGKPTFFQQFSSSFEEKPKIIMVQFNDYSLFNETRLWLELH